MVSAKIDGTKADRAPVVVNLVFVASPLSDRPNGRRTKTCVPSESTGGRILPERGILVVGTPCGPAGEPSSDFVDLLGLWPRNPRSQGGLCRQGGPAIGEGDRKCSPINTESALFYRGASAGH